jgi:para-nitrobenzyl esterase
MGWDRRIADFARFGICLHRTSTLEGDSSLARSPAFVDDTEQGSRGVVQAPGLPAFGPPRTAIHVTWGNTMSFDLKAVTAAVVLALIPLSTGAALAQSAAVQPAYSTQSSTVGELFADPQARAVVEKQFPGISSDFRMRMAKGKTFRQLSEMSPKKITAEKLDIIDAELASLPPRAR